MRNIAKWRPSKIKFDAKTGKAKPLAVGRGARFNIGVFLPIYVKTIREHASGHLLDCGAGDVPYYSVYKDLVKKVSAVDWSEKIDWAESRHNMRHIDKIADLNKAIPYPAKTFDTVLLADVLEHLHSPTVLMAEIRRVLKQNGKLICFVPFMYWRHEEPHDYHRYTSFMLEKLCRDAKLKIVELKPYGGGPDVMLDVANKLAAKSPVRSAMVYRLSTFLSRRRFYKRLHNRTKNKMPLGFVLVAQK